MIRKKPTPRAGKASLDMVLCTAVMLPIAAAMYVILRSGLHGFFVILGNTIGWPLM